jgi:hypothetical protein
VTTKIPCCAMGLGWRAYGGDAADGPAVRGALARTVAWTRGPRAGGASGFVLLVLFLKRNCSRFLYRS